MKKKKIVFLTIILIILEIIFYSYNITFSWDSSEYLGLADIIGSSSMKSNWIAHRGVGFPFIVKIGTLIGFTTLMFIFYLVTILFLILCYLKLKKENNLTKNTSIFFIFYTIIMILLHPIMFGYYHTLLTEFVAITFLSISVYLSWDYINCIWKDNPKKFCLYTIYLALLLTATYHVKQSLAPMVLAPILISYFFSILSTFTKQNVIFRTLSLIFIAGTVLLSIFAWKCFMISTVDVVEATYQARVAYAINKNGNIVAHNYFDKYINSILFKGKPLWVYSENFIIGSRIYVSPISNIVDCNPKYEKYLEPYKYINQLNPISIVFNSYLKCVYVIIVCITKLTELLAPIIAIILSVLYLFVMKKLSKNVLSLLQFAIMLYWTTFLGIFAYAFFGFVIDRYTVPLMFTGLLGNLILILFIVNLIKNKKVLKLSKP